MGIRGHGITYTECDSYKRGQQGFKEAKIDDPVLNETKAYFTRFPFRSNVKRHIQMRPLLFSYLANCNIKCS
jgi:hypothetical protein